MWVPLSLPSGTSETLASPGSHSSSIPPDDQAEGTRPEGSCQPGPGPPKKPEAGCGLPASSASFGANLPPGGSCPPLTWGKPAIIGDICTHSNEADLPEFLKTIPLLWGALVFLKFSLLITLWCTPWAHSLSSERQNPQSEKKILGQQI